MQVAVPQPGQVVRVRSRQYLVEDVVPPPQPADQHLVRLSCLDDDAQGQPLEALWEKEVDARVLSDEAWRALSEHQAYDRIEVARAARRFPVVLDLLEAGTANLTALRLLTPHLTPENHRVVLESARGKRTVEVREIVARLSPQPDVSTSIRRVPRTAPTHGNGAPRDGVTHSSPPLGPPATTAAAPLAPFPAPATATAPGPGSAPAPTPVLAPTGAPVPRPHSPGEATPLSEDRYHLKVTISGETVEKLRLAKDMLRHAVPSGDDAEILDRALTALLTELARKKFAATEKPRTSRGASSASRHIPAEVRRVVWVRDLGRCAFVGQTGRRCGERAFVEFHHVKPWIVGGEATVENIELRCRRHNGHEARVFFDRGSEKGALPSLASPPAL